MPEDSGWRTLPDGRKIKLNDGKRGSGAVVAAVAALAIAGGGAAGIGALGGAGGGAAGGFAENLAGDVADAMPGRNLGQRQTKAKESAEKGNRKETWSRMKMKELRHKAEHELECVVSATGKVREFLIRTPCTSLDRMLLAVGDGHGNAAVISVVRIGFKSAKQRDAFREVETVQGSGDVRPLETAAVLGISGVSLTGLNYHDRLDKNALVVAEADTATGHVDSPTLKALAYVASYIPAT